jgi:Protein of unknown function (DUF3632)
MSKSTNNLKNPPITDDSLHNELVQSIWTTTIRIVDNFSLSSVTVAHDILNLAQDFTKSPEAWNFYMLRMAFTTFWLAKQLPDDDSNQDRVVEMVMSIQLTANPPSPSNKDDRWLPVLDFLYIYRMHLFEAPLNPSYTEILSTKPYKKKRAPDPEFDVTITTEEWKNLNAFFARLVAALQPGLPLNEQPKYPFWFISEGIYAISEALEYQNSPETLENILPSAACWIIYAGKFFRRLWWVLSKSGDESSRRVPYSSGPLYKGKVPYCEERWDTWKRRLDALQEMETLSISAGGWIARARDSMLVDETAFSAGLEPDLGEDYISLNRPLDLT